MGFLDSTSLTTFMIFECQTVYDNGCLKVLWDMNIVLFCFN